MAKLNIRQQKFVEFMVHLGNAVKSAELAGYKPSNLHNTSAALMKNPHISKIIQEKTRELIVITHAKAEQAGMAVEEILNGLRDLALSSKTDSDKIRAYELLGKTKALFSDKIITEQKVAGVFKQFMDADWGELQEEKSEEKSTS